MTAAAKIPVLWFPVAVFLCKFVPINAVILAAVSVEYVQIKINTL